MNARQTATAYSKLSVKSQTVLPAEVRERLGVGPARPAASDMATAAPVDMGRVLSNVPETIPSTPSLFASSSGIELDSVSYVTAFRSSNVSVRLTSCTSKIKSLLSFRFRKYEWTAFCTSSPSRFSSAATPAGPPFFSTSFGRSCRVVLKMSTAGTLSLNQH